MPPEKDIILKTWEKLDDDVIIKEVATKGKHVNLCIAFLAQRNELSHNEATNYFLQKVNAYVYRLLSNRQLFKAEHILTNIDRVPKYVFYQIAAETSDFSLRDFIRDHLDKTLEQCSGPGGGSSRPIETGEDCSESRLIEANWRVYSLLKANVRQLAGLLQQLDSEYSVLEVETMSFNTFYTKDEVYRNAVALDLFFKNQETEISPLLDKHAVWNYLLRNNIDNLVKIWIQINACIRWSPELAKDATLSTKQLSHIKIDIYDDPRFNERLRQLFQRWEINDFMVSQLSNQRSMCRNEVLLNALATCGKFVDHERSDPQLVLRRLFTTQTLSANMELLRAKEFQEALTKYLVENKLFQLFDLSMINEECLQKMSTDANCDSRREVELYLCLKGLNNSDINNDSVLKMSRKVSEYLSNAEQSFYDVYPAVFLFEYFLDPENETFPDDDQRLWKLPHLRSFMNRLKHNPVSSISTKELLALHDLPCLETIRSNLFKNRDEDENDHDEMHAKQAVLKEHGLIPHLNHPILCEKYGTPVNLNYLHYIQQYRSCYALYLFYLDQLRCYSRITPPQINLAARSAAEVAVEHYQDSNLVAHCIAFIEMLGVDSAKTRAYVRCLNMIPKTNDSLKLSTLELLDRCESVIVGKSWDDPEILLDVEAIITVCRCSALKYPERFLLRLLADNDWFRFLLLVEYLDYPAEQVLELCRTGFGDANIGTNVMRAIKYYVETVQQRRSSSPTLLRRKSSRRRRKVSNGTAPIESHSSVSSESDIQSGRQLQHIPGDYGGAQFLCEQYNHDLFATVLLCSNETSSCARSSSHEAVFDYENFKQLVLGQGGLSVANTFVNLLERAVQRKWPLLAVLAGMTAEANLKYCWITWLMMSVEYPYQNRIETLAENVLVSDLVVYCVETGFVNTLETSVELFFPESNFNVLVKFLTETYALNFSEATTELLKKFLHIASKCPILQLEKLELINFTAKLLILHLDHNFESFYYQIQLLETLVASDINYFTHKVDFTTLLRIAQIIQCSTVRIDFIKFYDRPLNLQKELDDLCGRLVDGRFYKAAVEIADLSELPKERIIFEHWVNEFDLRGTCDFDQYQTDLNRYGFGAEVLLNFYIHIANRLEDSDPQRYALLKKTLDLINDRGLYPSEVYDRDRLEFELAVAYVRCRQDPSTLQLYHSHFFNTAFKRDRGVLYHTFLELKEVAGINDLTISSLKLIDPNEVAQLDNLINRLLEKGDIVQALRYQAIFDQRPNDLHFIVFCMALAESLVSLYNLTKEERLMLNEDFKRASNRFQRRTLRTSRISASSANNSWINSPMRVNANDSSDTSAGASEFEEVPSREKQDIYEAINGLGVQIQYGQEIAKRIVLTYRVAMYLDKEYNEILKIRDPIGFLAEVIQEDCIHKLEVISDVITSHKLRDEVVSEFLSREIATAVVSSKFYLLQQGSPPVISTKPVEELLWGYNIDQEFHLFLELAPNTTMLGNCLLRYCDAIKQYRRLEKSPELGRSESEDSGSGKGDRELLEKLRTIFRGQVLSLKKQNTIIVALLIKAHDCFVHECSVEGIVEVLQRCKALNSVLTAAKSWNLIVKLLVGIGRYREMYYCFETLIKHDQFESLLGQFDEKHSNGLKTAIISFLNEHCPEQKEFFRLAALHFLMYKEIAEMWETEAKSAIAKVLSTYEKPSTVAGGSPKAGIPRLSCTPLVVSELNGAMESYMHAAENYLLDNKMNLAQRTASNAELVALQISLVNQVLAEKTGPGAVDHQSCYSVLNIKDPELFVYSALSVPQALIVARTYDCEVNWTTALYQHYIVNGELNYLEDYLDRLPLTDEMIEALVKKFQQEPRVTPEMERAIAGLVDLVESVTLKYRLASLLGLKRTINELINQNSFYYLKDSDYGRGEHTVGGS
nr:spatacsin-like [Aedes albopictus]